jgi:hypothetical protein
VPEKTDYFDQNTYVFDNFKRAQYWCRELVKRDRPWAGRIVRQYAWRLREVPADKMCTVGSTLMRAVVFYDRQHKPLYSGKLTENLVQTMNTAPWETRRAIATYDPEKSISYHGIEPPQLILSPTIKRFLTKKEITPVKPEPLKAIEPFYMVCNHNRMGAGQRPGFQPRQRFETKEIAIEMAEAWAMQNAPSDPNYPADYVVFHVIPLGTASPKPVEAIYTPIKPPRKKAKAKRKGTSARKVKAQ